MGVGLGCDTWIIRFVQLNSWNPFAWKKRAIEAEKQLEQSFAEIGVLKGVLREKIEEQKTLVTVAEVNRHVEFVLSRVRKSLDLISAYHSGEKMATQSYLLDDE